MFFQALFILAISISTVLPSTAQAQNRPIISVSAKPNRSRNGENVQFKITVQTKGSGRLQKPSLSGLADWEVVKSFRSESPRVSYVNGQVEYKYHAEYSFFLRPLKTGRLSIPPIKLQIGKTEYKTDALVITVDKLPNGKQTQARRNHRSGNSASNNSSPRLPPLGGVPSKSPDIAPNSRETFFIRPEPSKTSVYEGEAIELAYVLYQRQRGLRNFEMAKFPDFKGFIKEELYISKNFTQQRVQSGNEILLRSEVIRYALFPIKSGELKISPFEIRATVAMRPEDWVDSLITGKQPPRLGRDIPMTKSSGVLKIEVKKLPATPPQAQFTGAVGDFKIEVKGPSGTLQVDQPFTVQFTIAGKGNVKLIEAPTLPLPKQLELYQTKNTSELRDDISGYKNFEFLILPRDQGPVEIPGFQWAYFDPTKESYELLTTPSLRLNIEAGAASNRKDETAPAIAVHSLSPFELSGESIGPKPTYAFSWLKGAWIGLGAFYALLLVSFWNRSKDRKRLSHLKNNPWVKTEEKIVDKEYKGAEGLAILVDQWTREYLTGYLQNTSLHSESTRSEFEQSIRSVLNTGQNPLLEDLRSLYADLDLVRFAGNKKNVQKIKIKDFFRRAKTLCEKIVNNCEFDRVEEDFDDDDY